MSECPTITITDVIPDPSDPNCSLGKWYNRLPFVDCEPGYTSPEGGLGFIGAGVCYCDANPEAQEKLRCAKDWTCWIKDYIVYIVVGVVILYIISRR